jgi:hypothetical protein
VPALVPEFTMPELEPIVAMAVLLLTHVPPVGAPVSVVADTVHIVLAPLIVGFTFTVTIVVALPQLFI